MVYNVIDLPAEMVDSQLETGCRVESFFLCGAARENDRIIFLMDIKMEKILIAEDDFASRIMLEGLLIKCGYDVIAVDNGLDALEILKNNQSIKISLLDWNMPGRDGIDICRIVRQSPSDNPPYIIMVTARTGKESIVEGLDAGANDYITKPFDVNELQARIRVGCRMVELQRDLVKAKGELKFKAEHDSLTGIYNRKTVLDFLDSEISRAERIGNELSLGIFDLDNFKTINDTYGHQTGDDVINGFVDTVRKSIRNYDILGRYGGEEFLLITPGAGLSFCRPIFERVRETAEKTDLNTRKGKLNVTVSIGICCFRKGQTSDSMLAASDAALYEAKKTGRNRIVCCGD